MMITKNMGLLPRWLLVWLVAQHLQQSPVLGHGGKFEPGTATTHLRQLFASFPLLSSGLGENVEDSVPESTAPSTNTTSIAAPLTTIVPTAATTSPPIQTTPAPYFAPSLNGVDVNSSNISMSPSFVPSLASPAPSTNATQQSQSSSSMKSPSSTPSEMPSSLPTTECHDSSDYQSPINGFACSAHANTDCLAWRFLGLNITELQELVNSCPITCGIECGAFQQLATSLVFRLAQVPGFLDQGRKATLEETSLEYLEGYVQEQSNTLDSSITIEFETAVLTFQNEVETPYNVRHRRHLRQPSAGSPQVTNGELSANASMKVLDVGISLSGFTVGIDSKDIKTLLQEGIKSAGYKNALRRSDDFFSFVEALSQNETHPLLPNAQIADEVTDSSRATIFVSFMVPLVVVGFAIVMLVYQRYASGAGLSFWPRERQRDGQNDMRSPERESSPTSSSEKNRSSTSGSPEGSVASDDETTLAGAGRHKGRSSIRRLFASLSLSRSRNSAETDSQDGSEIVDPRFEQSNVPVISGPVVSKMDYGLDDDLDDEQGRSFPPMIVIDNIDDNENLEATPSEIEEQGIDQSDPTFKQKDKALDDFASEFREAIKTHNKNSRSLVFPDAFKNFFESMTPNEPVVSESKPTLNSRSSLDMLFGSDSSDEDDFDEDDASIASTPVKSARPISDRPLRRTSSFNTFDDIDRQILPVIEQEIEEDMSTSLDRSLAPGMIFSSSPPHSGLLPMSPATPPEVIEKGRLRGLPPIRRFQTPERWRRGRRDHQPRIVHHESPNAKPPPRQYGKGSPLFSFSPVTKALLESSVGVKRPNLPRMGSSFSSSSTPGHHRHTSSSSSSGHHRRTSSSSISADGFRSGSADYTNQKFAAEDLNSTRFEFSAPRRGQLGLVLGEKSSRSGTYVLAVKDYSPLFGMMMKGDRILEIDAKNVSRAGLAEVSKLLTVSAKPRPFVYPRSAMSSSGGGSNINNTHHNYVLIAVSRKCLPPLGADNEHKRHGSHGSSGSGSLLGSSMVD